MGLLDGKVAIITGAGGGIGRAEALRFAEEGAKVVVNDLGSALDGAGADTEAADQVVKEIREKGGTALASYDSVATIEGAQAVIDRTVEAFGRVDVLVANAGILCDKNLLKMDKGMWDAVLAVDLTGTFLSLSAAARQMVAQGEGGRIVTTTSHSGLLGQFGQSNYAAAKAGVYGLTRTAAIELQKHRITVNAIAPIAKTRMSENLPMMQGMDALTPEHVVPAAVFLASDLCGDRTGQVLAVAGARMYVYKVVESAGRFKETDGGMWTPQEIADHFGSIAKT